LKKERVSHCIHANESSNFKITLRGAQGQLVNTLIRGKALCHVPVRLVTSHEFHVHNTYVTRDIVFKSPRQLPSQLKVFEKGKRWTPTRGSVFLLLTRGDRQCSTFSRPRSQTEGPVSPNTSLRFWLKLPYYFFQVMVETPC
jgi:hypothetical protein